jgi:hypothetical protein
VVELGPRSDIGITKGLVKHDKGRGPLPRDAPIGDGNVAMVPVG